ncbi:hypothetical protein GLX30_01740 [Streptomyces sp. Tu 2975]|uniref:DUF6397 family protein n=1 Tax=Streptomyces sp. Tu 2975 TaxID=2676871 RepID=UPI00135A587A|nr:DUF6397 family protein [Streptomyces sp. Tu 2975]QIP83015.1 hypothetical protein GLX30_01740 [Streptomyces sp. Tu 2975]
MTVRQTSTTSLGLGRAAQELALKRGELELALQLGQVRAVQDDSGGPPRVERREIDRLRAGHGFAAALRERLRTVGTVDGAELASISQGRFLRLARTGHFAPVRFYVNRYHAVVWLYLAEEVLDFARDHAPLLTGRTPPDVRALLATGEDRRPRNWRGRRLGQLLRASSDPWRRAAAIAAVLDPVTVAGVVPDPYERSLLSVLRPEMVPAPPKSLRGREIVERLVTADHADEILWHRASLADALREAREHSAAPVARHGRRVRHSPALPARAPTARPRSPPSRTVPWPWPRPWPHAPSPYSVRGARVRGAGSRAPGSRAPGRRALSLRVPGLGTPGAGAVRGGRRAGCWGGCGGAGQGGHEAALLARLRKPRWT